MTRGGPGPGGLDVNAMMKQVQQMQSEMMEAQEKLQHEVVDASAGGGMVKVKMSGDLRLLEVVHEDSRVTQRGMAKKLGIALGLANIYLKRMIHKGYIKVVNVQPNRISYLITPRGIAEKARLTYEFMDYSLHLYGEVRQHLQHRFDLRR